MVITIVVLLVFLFYVNIYQSKRSLHMLQQNLYNENNRYGKWMMKNKEQFVNIMLVNLAICLLQIFFSETFGRLAIFSLWVIAILALLYGMQFKKKLKQEKTKKGLVITARIKRLITTLSILYLIPVVFLILHFENIEMVWKLVFALCVMTQINALVVLIAMFINVPIEKCVYLHFKSMAQKKLKSINQLKIIGITGSYGKTSSKNILRDILNIKYNALATPKNLNTFNGLIMTVNNHMDKFKIIGGKKV